MERELPRLRRLLAEGVNITAYLDERYGQTRPRADIVEYAYDLQAGSYTAALADPAALERKLRWGAALARLLDELEVETVCDAGTGEGTTLAFVIDALRRPARFAGFDISVSRLLVGRRFLEARGCEVQLFAAELGAIPLADGACDVVMTQHAIEPNHGSEDTIVGELARVTRRYVLLVEPSWELATVEQRERMRSLGYARGLPQALERAGLRILRHERWADDANQANPAALLLAERTTPGRVSADLEWASPLSGLPLRRVPEGLYCDGDGFLFPSVSGIPVLRRRGAVLATRYGDLSPPTADHSPM